MQPNQGATDELDQTGVGSPSHRPASGSGRLTSGCAAGQPEGQQAGSASGVDRQGVGQVAGRTARWFLFVFLLCIGAGAAVLSFSTLRDLALACKYPAELAWVYPLIVDATVAAGTLVWLGHWADRPSVRFARGLTLGALGLTLVLNASQVGLHSAGIAPAPWAVVAIGAVPAALLGATIHLAVLVGRRPVEVAVPGMAEESSSQVEAPGRLSDDEIVALIRIHDLSGTHESIRRRFGVGQTRASRIKAALTNGHTGGDQR